MSVKIRLARTGSKKRPVYFFVAQDTRSARDGRFLEKLGTYDPRNEPKFINVKIDRINAWLDKGALPTAPMRELLREMGVLKARAEGSEMPCSVYNSGAVLESTEATPEAVPETPSA